VHGKTHWYLNYELQFKVSLNSAGTVVYSESNTAKSQTFMGKRFKQPKKYKNSDSPRNPSGSATVLKFAYVYYVSGGTAYATQTSFAIGEFKSWQTIEDTQTYSTNYGGHSYVTNSISGLTNYIWGYSFARMNI
jgi:hypothetical protein